MSLLEIINSSNVMQML